MKRRTLLCGLFVISALPLNAVERLTMRVSPAVAFAPATVRVRATVEADPENRGIEIIAESPDFYRSSEIPLDGEHAPRTTIVEFRSLPGGTYEVTAVLIGVSDRRTKVSQYVNVVAAGAAE
ncbi:MAG: hypothetical protein HY047_16630 [Acidobacteria bacterium]|nr:hypothetical protein [Acidobacteriota bacterium]